MNSKKFDSITRVYKKLQEKELFVYVENFGTNRYSITCSDHHTTLHTLNSRKEAVEFCNFLNLNIIAFVTHK